MVLLLFYILSGNFVSKKGDIFVHNTQRIDEKMLVALDLLCLFKPKVKKYCLGDEPTVITFITKDNLVYHIIVVDENSKESMVKILNSKTCPITEADKLILAFPDISERENIKCRIPFVYVIYPELEIID